jgi:hypothetical protein
MADNILIPADLNFTGYPDPSDKNYWDVKITGLKPNTGYGIQFQWKFANGELGAWSASRFILANTVPAPAEPVLSASDVVGGQGIIAVKLGAAVPNTSRVNIHISGGKFGDGTNPADYFLAPGTKSIGAEAGTYYVQLKAVSSDGKTVSVFSQVRTVVVTGTSVIVEAPTLPTGLSVTPISFGVKVSWNGSYVTDTFKGFQSIVINASTANLGPSVTTEPGVPVAQLSVNNSANSANIPISSNVGYDFDTYFYYIATNTDGTLYKNNGVATWTRINSTGVRPTKANLIDLANGLISIENLVAGNGNFTSYLKAGADGGARVTLSGLTTTSNGVLPGLTIYKSDGTTAAMRADFAGNLSFSGDITGSSGTFGGVTINSSGISSTNFNITSTGIVEAKSGTIGGLTLSAQSIGNSGNTFKIDKDGIITLGATTGNHIRIASDGSEAGIFHKSDNATVGNFKITTAGTMQLGTDTGVQNFLSWNGSSLTMRGALEIIGGPTKIALDAAAQKALDAEAAAAGAVGSLAGLSLTVSGYTNSIDTLNTFKAAVSKTYSGSTVIDGGKVRTGLIASNGYADGYPYSAINLDTGDFYMAGGAFSFDAKPVSNSFVITIGNMKIGRNVIIGGTTKTTEGIYLDNNDYWQADGKIKLGNGVIEYGGGTLSRANPLVVNSPYIKFAYAQEGVLDSDNNNYGGDPYLVLNSNGELTRGRAFHYGGTTAPTSANTGRFVLNTLKQSQPDIYPNPWEYLSFNSGDVWMTVD